MIPRFGLASPAGVPSGDRALQRPGRRWLLAAAWRVLYAAQASGQLATSGPYARVRHPQYVGFVLIMIGFLLQWPTLVTLAMFPVLLLVYVRLARREERDSAAAFGEAWTHYARTTPAFFPRWRVGKGETPPTTGTRKKTP